MNEVRPRSRKSTAKLAAALRAREIQGMLAMHGLETESTTAHGRDSAEKTEPTTWRASEVKPLPYRQVLATWPDDWRERWGRRANELEESGLSWRDAEGQAFVETWSRFHASGHVERN